MSFRTDHRIKVNISAPAGFAAILAVMVLFQVMRLPQTAPVAWLAVDYAGRIVALVLLAIIPSTRAIAYTPEKLRIGSIELLAWSVAIVAVTLSIVRAENYIWQIIPDPPLGKYPPPSGALYLFDLTFGLGLVALHEEVFFRRVARAGFRQLGDGLAMVIATSLLFGLYHWSTGVPNMISATAFGALFTLFYRRAGALWPAVLAHYLIDLYHFF